MGVQMVEFVDGGMANALAHLPFKGLSVRWWIHHKQTMCVQQIRTV